MSKPEWGVKRICFNCGARFYDLQRAQVVCPKCGTEYDPEAFLKSRRSRPSAIVQEKDPPPIVLGESEAEPDTEEAEELETEAVEDEDADAADDEAEEVLEDTSELGEDDDDMAEVIENVDDEEEP